MVSSIQHRRGSRRGLPSYKVMIAMGLFLTLISTTIAISQRANARPSESARERNLFTLRSAIDEFTYDKHRTPRSLQELVNSRYLGSGKAADGTPYPTW